MFDPLTHVAPKYTIMGTMVNSTKLLRGPRLDKSSSEVKIPKNWTRPGSVAHPNNKPAIRTKRELEATRRKEKLPDSTYDLDGDGAVSNKDFFLARQFDTEAKGSLTAEQ